MNWARAVMTLRPLEGELYRLELANRGMRAGARHPDGTSAGNTVYLRHSKRGIRWEQVDAPGRGESTEESTPKKDRKAPLAERIAAFNTASFIGGCKVDGEGVREIASRLEEWLSDTSNKTGDICSASNTVCRQAIDLMIQNRKLKKTGSGKKVSIFKGENA